MNNQPTEPAPNSPHWRYIVAPFCLLLLCLGTINIANWLGSRPTTVTAEATTAVTTSAASPATATTAVTLTPMPATATPTATRYSPPVYDASIRLLGPPNGAQFETTGSLSFYWQWSLPLAEDEFFNVYAVVEEQLVLLGTIYEPNLGELYYLAVDLQDSFSPTAAGQWYVQLQSHFAEQPLSISQIRIFTITTPAFAP